MLLLALTPFAAAYELAGYAWREGQQPVEIHWTGTDENLSHDELQAAVEGAAAAWTEVGACDFGFTVVEDPDAESSDAAVVLLFGDPADELDAAFWLDMAVADSGPSFTMNGQTFTEAPTHTITFNDIDFWVSDAVIDAGACPEDHVSLQAVLTHELGHVLGLGHSCDENEACDAAGEEATMYWTTDYCDDHQSSLGTDDIGGLQAIYGCDDADTGLDSGADTASGGDTSSEPRDTGSWDIHPADPDSGLVPAEGCSGCASTAPAGSFGGPGGGVAVALGVLAWARRRALHRSRSA